MKAKLAAAIAVAVTCAACGTATQDAGTSSSVVETTVTEPEPEFTLNTDSLVDCESLQGLFVTVPDWLVDGVDLVAGHSSVATNEPTVSAAEWLLIETDDSGEVVSYIRAAEAPGPGVGGEAVPTRVRGTEGVAGVHTSRTSIGTFAAWEEDGVHWTAGSAMGVDDLLEALDPLEISTDGVSDPTERFEVVWASPAIERSGYRVTNLEVIDDSGQHVYIRIDDTGTIALPTFGWVSYRELDDRPVLAGGNQTASVLADGSSVWLTVYAEAETTELDEEFIDTLLKSLRHREPDELTDLPPFTDGRGGAVMTEEPMCLE